MITDYIVDEINGIRERELNNFKQEIRTSLLKISELDHQIKILLEKRNEIKTKLLESRLVQTPINLLDK